MMYQPCIHGKALCKECEVPLNQCDGCQRGLPIQEYTEPITGKKYLFCTKDRYEVFVKVPRLHHDKDTVVNIPVYEDLHNKISSILVKWDMPTRQAAISEIESLFSTQREELKEKIEKFGDIWKLEQTAQETQSGCPKFIRVNRELLALLDNDTNQ